MKEEKIVEVAVELVKAMNKAVDENLPNRLASIVKLHSKLAVGAAFVPIPFVDLAANATNTWSMYVRINRELDMPFSDHFLRSVAAGVMTNIGGTVAGVVVMSTVFKFIPGLGTFGGAVVLAATLYGLTIAAGIVYMKAIAKLLATGQQPQEDDNSLRTAAEEVMRDKAAIRKIVKEAKRDYRDEQATGQSPQSVGPPPPPDGHHTMLPVPPAPEASPSRTLMLSIRGQTHGPYTIDEIRQWRADGRLGSDSHFWEIGTPSWRPISDL